MKYTLLYFKHITNFRDRSNRRELFIPNFVFLIITIILSYFAISLYETDLELEEYEIFSFSQINFDIPWVIIGIIIWTILTLASLACIARRLHDSGHSGAWFFISFIPTIGNIWLLILLLTKGDKDSNNYGDAPLSKSSTKDDPYSIK